MHFYGTRHHGCRADEYTWRGHRLIVLENELLRVAVVASKGADIVELRYKPRDLDVLWHAPQPLLPPGQEIPTVDRRQGHFLDYFPGGWQEVFPNAGPATVYRNAELGQHGEVALLPWDVRIVDDGASRIQVEFGVETLRTPFRLTRAMTLESGSAVLHFDERVINLGEEELSYSWGHHPALGAPFLEPGCTLELPPCEVTQSAYAEGLKRRFAIGHPGTFPYLETLTGGLDRVDVVQAKECRTEDVLLFTGFDKGWCAVRNPRQKLSVEMRWPQPVFPYVWSWQVYGGSWGYPYYGRLYTLAVEPFNCPIVPLAEAAEKKLVPALAAGAEVEAHLEFEIRAQ